MPAVRSQVLFSVALILALALAASGLAFVAGKSAADPAGQYDRGVKAGERLGRQQARAEFVAGSDRYRQIFGAGRERGRAEGRRQGRVEGMRRGRARGRDDAFGGYSEWKVGRWYLVNVAQGRDGARYGIGSRVYLEGYTWYALCKGGRVCRRETPPAQDQRTAAASATTAAQPDEPR